MGHHVSNIFSNIGGGGLGAGLIVLHLKLFYKLEIVSKCKKQYKVKWEKYNYTKKFSLYGYKISVFN